VGERLSSEILSPLEFVRLRRARIASQTRFELIRISIFGSKYHVAIRGLFFSSRRAGV
jgi:hypothetical protein